MRPHRPVPDRPLVSVVVPVRNGERYLRECLDSLVAQTYPETEIVLMDDASTDGTPDIAASYSTSIRHYRQAHPRGQFNTVNDGIGRARGELVAVYHADDVYHPEIVERQAAYLAEHADVGAVFCKDIFIDAEGRPFGKLELPVEIPGGEPLAYATVLDALLTHKNTFLRCPSSMIRAGVYTEIGGYREDRFRNTSDLDMWLRIARRYRIAILDEHLFWYRRGHGSSSERYHSRRAEPERFFEIMDLELAARGRSAASPGAIEAYEGNRAVDWLGVAVNHYVRGDRTSARDALSRVGVRRILASRMPRRTSLLVLFGLMRALAPFPRVRVAAAALDRRSRPASLRTPRAARRLPAPA